MENLKDYLENLLKDYKRIERESKEDLERFDDADSKYDKGVYDTASQIVKDLEKALKIIGKK